MHEGRGNERKITKKTSNQEQKRKENQKAREAQFLELLFFDSETTVTMEPDTQQKIRDCLFSALPKSSYTDLELGQILGLGIRRFEAGNKIHLLDVTNAFIAVSHHLMIYFDQDTNIELVATRNVLLLEIINVIYEQIYKNSMPDEFKETVHKDFLDASCLNFMPKIAIDNFHNIHFSRVLCEKKPLNYLVRVLKNNENCYEKTVETFEFLNKENAKEGLKLLKERHAKLKEEYRKSTQIERVSYQNIVVLIVGLIFLSMFSSPLLVYIFYGLLALSAYQLSLDLFNLDERGPRVMNNQCKKSYSDSLTSNMNKLECTPFRLSFEKRKAAGNNHQDCKALLSAQYEWQYRQYMESFVTIKSKPEKRKKSLLPQEKKGHEEKTSEEAPRFVSLVFADILPDKTEYGPENLKKLYPRYKKTAEEQKQQKQQKQQKVIPAVGNPYTKIMYKLSPELQDHGCYVQEDESCAYFDLGKYRNEVGGDILKGFQNNEYTFGGREGDFKVFKYMKNLGQYEFKLFGTKRIIFELEPNKIDVFDAEHRTKPVPHYRAVQYGDKS